MTHNESSNEKAARETFSRLASHALRGASHSFVNALALLADEQAVGALNPTQRRLLKNARSSASQLRQLSDDMALLTDAASGPVALNYEPIAVTTLVRKAIEQAQQPDAPNPPREIDVRITKASPTLHGDGMLLQRALAAIVENALRFSPSDTPIIVESRKRHDRIILTVSDAGDGVPADQSEAIFEPLVAAQRPLHIVGIGLGLGVGLAVARAICEAHGGPLTLSKEQSRGTVFTMDLPISEPLANTASG